LPDSNLLNNPHHLNICRLPSCSN